MQTPILVAILALLGGSLLQAQNTVNNSQLFFNGNFRLYSGLEFSIQPQDNPLHQKSYLDFADLADSAHKSRYDTTNLSFKLTMRTYFEYDSGGMMIQAINKSTDKNGNWKNYSLDTLSYIGSQLKKIVSKQWDSQQSVWKNTFRYDYFYDSVNILQSMMISTWNADSLEWESSEQESYTYQSPNLLSIVLHQFWNSALLSWENSSKTTYVYLPAGVISSVQTDQWNSSTQEWISFTRSTYSNDGAINLSITLEKYNMSQLQWEYFEKYAFTYTSSGKKETITKQVSGGGSSWLNSSLTINTFEGEKLVNELVKGWQPHLNDWRNYEQQETFFSQHEIFGVEEIIKLPFLVQNPVKAGAAINYHLPERPSGYLFELLDLQGRTLSRTTLQAGNHYVVPFVMPGLYLLKASSKGQAVRSQKLMIY